MTNQARSVDALIEAKCEFDDLIEQLRQMSDDHFGAHPDRIVWGTVEHVRDMNKRLRDMADAYHRRGEYA